MKTNQIYEFIAGPKTSMNIKIKRFAKINSIRTTSNGRKVVSYDLIELDLINHECRKLGTWPSASYDNIKRMVKKTPECKIVKLMLL